MDGILGSGQAHSCSFESGRNLVYGVGGETGGDIPRIQSESWRPALRRELLGLQHGASCMTTSWHSCAGAL